MVDSGLEAAARREEMQRMEAEEAIFHVRIARTAVDIALAHLRPVAHYLQDPEVTEVAINRHDSIWVERHGQMERAKEMLDEVSLQGAYKAIASANRKSTVSCRIMDARLPEMRIAVAVPPVAIHGTAMCIRRHARSRRTLADYRSEWHEVLPRARPRIRHYRHPMDYIEDALAERHNLVIAGATGSGKTTFLGAFIGAIRGQRVITIEDTHEIALALPNLVQFEAHPDEGVGVRQLIKLSLRFRPDRIFVGEVRGAEAWDMLDAMNTGHQGSACSLHASSALGALHRLETLCRMHPDVAAMRDDVLRSIIGSTIDAVVFCERRGSTRGPVDVIRVTGVEEGQYKIVNVVS